MDGMRDGQVEKCGSHVYQAIITGNRRSSLFLNSLKVACKILLT